MVAETGLVGGLGIKGSIRQRVIKTSRMKKNTVLDDCPDCLRIFLGPWIYGIKNYGGIDYHVAEFTQTVLVRDDYSHHQQKVHVEAVYIPRLEKFVLFGRRLTDSSKLEEIQPDDDIPEVWRREFSSTEDIYGPCKTPDVCKYVLHGVFKSILDH